MITEERRKLIGYNLYMITVLENRGSEGSVYFKLKKLARNGYKRKLENYREDLSYYSERIERELQPEGFKGIGSL